MRIYRAIIWISLLLVIAEVLVLSDVKLAPLNPQPAGQVLGVSTSLALEELADLSFPASYYTTPEAISDNFLDSATATAMVDKPLATDLVAATATESDAVPAEQPADVDSMVEWLNDGESTVSRSAAAAETADRVPSLINKNKRLYLQTMRREIDQIKEQFTED